MDYAFKKFNVIFKNDSGEQKLFIVNRGVKIKEIVKAYFREMQKMNLLVNNIENILFIFDGKLLNEFYEKTIESISLGTHIFILVNNGVNNNKQNYEIIKTIKDNTFTSVFKAKTKNPKSVRNINPIGFRYIPESEDKFVAI